MGNYDEGTGFDMAECGCAYTNLLEKALGDQSFAWTKANTSDANKAWLRSLAREIRFEADGLRFLLVHGSARAGSTSTSTRTSRTATFARIAADADADVIVCGHTHRPYDKTVAGTWFVNDGSAGKPKDGDPRAGWALVDGAARAVEFRRVAYDVEQTVQAIIASELPDEFATEVREARGLQTATSAAR